MVWTKMLGMEMVSAMFLGLFGLVAIFFALLSIIVFRAQIWKFADRARRWLRLVLFVSPKRKRRLRGTVATPRRSFGRTFGYLRHYYYTRPKRWLRKKFRKWWPAAKPPAKTPSAPKTPKDDTSAHALPQPFPLVRFWLIVILVNAVWGLIDVLIGMKYSIMYIDVNAGLVSLFIQIAYFASSYKSIGPDEIGARIFFGKPVNNLSSGPTFVPLFIMNLVRAPKTVIEQEIPAEPELIWRSDDPIPDEKLEEGFKPPIRVTFSGVPGSREPLEQELTNEVTPVVQWHINDLCKFISHVGTIDQARTRFEDLSVSFLTEKLSKISLRKAMNSIGSFSRKLRTVIEANIQSTDWGITLDSVRIKKFDISHNLNIAIQGVPESMAKAKITVNAALANKESLSLEGEGKGNAERAVLGGRAAGLLDLAASLQLPTEQVLAAETARAVTNNPNQTVIVGAEGMSSLFGLATGLGKTLSGIKGGVVPATPPTPAPTPAPTTGAPTTP